MPGFSRFGERFFAAFDEQAARRLRAFIRNQRGRGKQRYCAAASAARRF